MGVMYQQENGLFHLYNDNISYIMKILKNGHLGHLYFGKRLHLRDDYDYIIEEKWRSQTAYIENGNGEMISLAGMMQEFPVHGNTDFRQPAFAVRMENGSAITDAKFAGARIVDGKPELSGLPATYTEDPGEAQTLQIDLIDALTGLKVTLNYTVFEKYNAIARSVCLANEGKEALHITTAMSFSLDLPDSDYEWMQFSGAWARERYQYVRPLTPGIVSVGSRAGISSQEQNPFVILKRKDTNEEQGEAIGLSLIYSGNFLAQAEVDAQDVTRLMIGLHPDSFDWKLDCGETLQLPEAVAAYTKKGLNDLSSQYHHLYRQRLCRGPWRDKGRPILLNNWEATYFDITEEKLVKIASKAKECGVELFVLDDGWFGDRRDDHAGLGDWVPSPDVLPNGIGVLADKIHALGLMFGLWFEPEMVNADSDLFRAHPDWILQTPGREPSLGRHQLVLDFSRKEVVDCIYDMMAKVMEETKLDYIKWDMNRPLTEVYSAALPYDRQGEVFHRYVLGVYDLYDRLTKRFPDVLFESCASGGARFDAGLLYYAPQAWTSDDTDAMERLKIQYGTSYGYPVASMGAHVSAVPNHQLNRITSIDTRANVAMFGTFGYELDLNLLSDEEIERVKAQIEFMKANRELLQQGDFYRILSPFKGNETEWICVSADKKHAIAAWFRVLNVVNGPVKKIRFTGLDEDTLYTVSGIEGTFYGDELMEIGVPEIENMNAHGRINTCDYMSRLYEIHAVTM